MIRVIFRTCEKVNSLHGLPRPFGLSKKETIEKCFKSLVKSLSILDHEIYIVGDEISDDLIEFFANNSKKIRQTINEPMGNDESLKRCFQLLNTENWNDDDIVYFVEDDYLHFYQVFDTVFKFVEKAPFELFVHPTDYPDQYTRQDLVISALVLYGPLCHFRQVSSSTFTLMGKASTFRKYYSHLISSCVGADDGFLSKIFTETPCFSPIPGLATHMHQGTMSRYNDWEGIAKSL